ncbi:ABC transporter substrate-binding protein [Paraburkholderia sp.]|uniref:ABC transporter substrate-binding protein n=1 Tax=Paraburkholderia sp. TaxID=1926495 RepID=UPI0039E4EC94
MDLMPGLRCLLRIVPFVLLTVAAIDARADQQQVVVSSWGGSIQDAQRKAIFIPFEKETGIKVVEATQPMASKIIAMEASNNIEFDVAQVVPVDFLVLKNQNLLEKIDYSMIDQKTVLDGLTPAGKDPYGVAAMIYSRVIAWSTKAFPPGTPHPESYADVWNVKRFPGKRVFDAGDAAFPPIEYALLADGVSADHLYPLDFKRAYQSLSKIQPAVAKWAQGAAVGPQALVDGEASVAVVSQMRIAQMKDEGAPVDYTFNEGLLKGDYWVIPKGAHNYRNAMKFIAFASRPDVWAAFVKLVPASPPNKFAFQYIDAQRAKELPTAPQNLAQQIWVNDAWWSTIDPATKKSWRAQNVVEWNKWQLTQ